MSTSLSYVGYRNHRVICEGCEYDGYHSNVSEAIADYRRHLEHPNAEEVPPIATVRYRGKA